jgi:L-lactate dehydrogenase (cytochrome)
VQDEFVTQNNAPAPGLAEYQNEIYLRGLGGETPSVPVSAEALERAAYAAMDPEAVGYVAGGAGAEHTVAANRASFDRWRIVPRMLRGVASRDLRTSLLGTDLPAPVLLGPVGVQQIIHPDGERATARGAAALGVPYVLSTASSTAMEDVVEAAPDAPRWYQLYWPKNRDLAASLVSRAEKAGFSALVVTLDTWMLGWRPRDLERAYLPFLRGIGIANYTSDPVFFSLLPDDVPREQAAVLTWAATFADPSLTWSDIAWLRERTSLPLVLKGISCGADASLALDVGADAVQVSNHGGRQVDGAVAAIDALPEVVDTIAGRVPVLFDSGIRTGADAVKALALGADAVMLGRLFTWGLALGGAEGVTAVLRAFLADLDNTMALSGHARPAELTRSSLTRAPA